MTHHYKKDFESKTDSEIVQQLSTVPSLDKKSHHNLAAIFYKSIDIKFSPQEIKNQIVQDDIMIVRTYIHRAVKETQKIKHHSS